MLETLQKTYTKAEVLKSALDYFDGDELAADVWTRKYCLKDDKNYYELTPDDMHRRIARELARVESKYPNPLSESEIFETLKGFKRIVPAGSPMAGIGNTFQVVSLSNCFVIGNPGESDSYGGIMKLDQELVQLEKRRGGVGTDLSFVRPSGSPVKNSAITSTGVVPFMERFSRSTKEVAQDGRRGALMESISIKHPDSEKFVDAKLTAGTVTGANISVKLDHEFMRSAMAGEMYTQQFPIDSDNPITTQEIDAQKLWKKIIHNAWKSAEPGILFWDTIINESVADCYADQGYKTISTNPCGEIPLCADDSCRLLAINLLAYVKNAFYKDDMLAEDAYFDWELFAHDVQMAQRYMDDIIDLEIEKIDAIIAKIDSDPEEESLKRVERELWERIKDKTIRGRRTGLGVTGEGDMLAALGLVYGTDEATDFSERVHQTLKLNAYRSSTIMARERGAFPVFDVKNEANNPFSLRIKAEDPELYDDMAEWGRRNISLLTIAPTGTSSIMTQTTSGIEPAFLIFYMRRRKINPQEKGAREDFVDEEGISWQEYPVFHHNFELWLEVNGYNIEEVKEMKSAELDEIIKDSPYYKATSKDVDWVKKVEMQGRIQKHVDHSISVTVNLPKETTEEVVSKVYETGWKSGCKGITVYRDGSRSGVLVNVEEKKEEPTEIHVPKRTKRLKADIHHFQNNLEKWIAVVGIREGRPYEIFTGKFENGLSQLPSSLKECEVVKNIVETIDEEGKTIKKKRYDIEYVDKDGEKHVHMGLNHAFNPEFWNYAKLVSGVLRQRMPMVYVHDLVDSLNFTEDHINIWKNGVARVIKKYIKNGEKGKGVCLECGSDLLHFVEGCLVCKSCGSSKCG